MSIIWVKCFRFIYFEQFFFISLGFSNCNFQSFISDRFEIKPIIGHQVNQSGEMSSRMVMSEKK